MSRQLIIELVGDQSKLTKALDDAAKKTDTFAGKMDAAGKKMRRVGAKMSAFVTAPLVGVGVAAFKTASDVNESLSKVNNVFGKSAGEIDAWAKTAATSIGLSRGEALDAAGSFGNMFVQLGIGAEEAAKMSTGITGLAADFASFHNADITSVISAQSAAFRGEYDALQRFLPLINAAAVSNKAMAMTGKTVEATLTAQEKALAVNALMAEGAGDAMGDFARTSDGAANQQRILTARVKDAAGELGNQLLPIGEKVLGWAASLAQKFGGLSGRTQTVILVVAGLAAAIGPLVTIIGALSTAMAFLAANPIVLVIAAIAALAAGLVYAYRNSETFRNVVTAAFEAVRRGISAVWRFVEPILERFRRGLDKIAGPLGTVLGGAAKLGGAIGGAIGKLPFFHDGGRVPGAPGANVPIMAQAGETVLPMGARLGGAAPITIIVQGSVISERDLGDTVRRALADEASRSGPVGARI